MHELHIPGRILYFGETNSRWTTFEAFTNLTLSTSMLTDHFPERVDAIVNGKVYQELLIDMIEKRMVDFFE